MRRVVSILLTVFFALGPLGAALETSGDARLPACCRRNGAHHCAMSGALVAWMLRAEGRVPQLSAPSHCPMYPDAAKSMPAPVQAMARDTGYETLIAVAAELAPASDGTARNAGIAPRESRGPPAVSLG